MKTKITIAVLTLFLVWLEGNTQTEWTGPKITFTKDNSADWTLEANQDRITSNVWLTRQNQWSIFNIAQGDISEKTSCIEIDGQPYDTKWAFGTIADGVGTLTFDSFLGVNFTNCGPGGTGSGVSPVGINAVLHLITDNIYIDIKFLSWAIGDSGGSGGFSYERSTDQNLDVNDFELNKTLLVFPNPSQNFIQITGLTNQLNFKMHNILGVKVLENKIEPNKKIDITNLGKGIYFIHFENGAILKFIKQ